jgi:hypothetical protein
VWCPVRPDLPSSIKRFLVPLRECVRSIQTNPFLNGRSFSLPIALSLPTLLQLRCFFFDLGPLCHLDTWRAKTGTTHSPALAMHSKGAGIIDSRSTRIKRLVKKAFVAANADLRPTLACCCRCDVKLTLPSQKKDTTGSALALNLFRDRPWGPRIYGGISNSRISNLLLCRQDTNQIRLVSLTSLVGVISISYDSDMLVPVRYCSIQQVLACTEGGCFLKRT